MALTRSIIRSKINITSFPCRGDASIQMAFLLWAEDKAPLTMQRSHNSLLIPSNQSAQDLYDTVEYANEFQSRHQILIRDSDAAARHLPRRG